MMPACSQIRDSVAATALYNGCISDAQEYKLNNPFDLCLSLRSTSTFSPFVQQQMPTWSFTIQMWAMKRRY
jgi:hypothetical protein